MSSAKSKSIAIDCDRIRIGFGWDAYTRQGSPGLLGGLSASHRRTGVDCDGSARLLDRTGALIGDRIDYANREVLGGAIRHGGDSRTGFAEGDDETIDIDLAELPKSVASIELQLDMLEEKKRFMTFGKIQNAFFRIIDRDMGQEIFRWDFRDESGRVLSCGHLFRTDQGSWRYEGPFSGI